MLTNETLKKLDNFLVVENVYVKGYWKKNNIPFLFGKNVSPVYGSEGDTLKITYTIEFKIPESGLDEFIKKHSCEKLDTSHVEAPKIFQKEMGWIKYE